MADQEQDRTMVERALEQQGLAAQSWRDGEDGLEAVVGKFRVLLEDEDRGLYEGNEGLLVAVVVGAAEYGNQRVMFTLHEEGMDGGNEVRGAVLDVLEPVDD